jgi:CIC family chloride channel protein
VYGPLIYRWAREARGHGVPEVMIAVAIASVVSRALSYGTIYTTKLLRRGTDIDRAAPWRAVGDLKVTDVMRPFRQALPVPPAARTPAAPGGVQPAEDQEDPALPGRVTYLHDVQALRQLAVYGRDGLPVVSPDERHLQGWVTSADVMRALARRVAGTVPEAARAQAAADPEHDDEHAAPGNPPVPLPGYYVAEIVITPGSPAAGRKLGDVSWPVASTPVTLLHGGSLRPPRHDAILAAGDRVSLLIPATEDAAPRDAVAGEAELPR